MDKQNLQTYNMITRKLLSQFAADESQNVVFSPLSVLILLGMLADATEGQTQDEINKVLGDGLELQAVIDWLSYIQKKLEESGALKSSNAVCIKEEIKSKIVDGYENHLKESFNGKLFSAANMVDAVNEWVNRNTKGMIQKIADDSMKSMLACLLNAIAFEARWVQKYKFDDLDYWDFNNSDGTSSEVTMMRSTEWQYIEDAHFTGFTKPYKDVGYSYIALLPKQDDSGYLKDAIRELDLTALYNSRVREEVHTEIPEYKLEFSEQLNDFCKSLGIEKVFSDSADFSPMIDEWIKVDQIIHKAFIQVDRNGTKAAAVTAAVCVAGGCPVMDYKTVILDRPFIYAVVHDDTGIPVFVGVVNNLEGGDYELEDIELDELYFDSDEECREYVKSTFREIAERIHPDKSSIYEISEEIRNLFAEAQRYYKEQDPYGLQVVKFNIDRLLDELDD